jgi:hypothetical protein
METRVIKHDAKTLRIDHPEASYGIFCFNEEGDLFLNSDWGFYGYAWRSFGESFEAFLASANTEYIMDKLSYNFCEVSGKRDIPPHRKAKLKILVGEFIDALKVKDAVPA